MFDIINGDVTLNMFPGCINQVCRWFQTIYILKSDGRLPSSCFFLSPWFSLPDIFIKFAHVPSFKYLKVKKLSS